MYVGALRPWQVLIPPGVAHGYKVIGREDALLVYLTDRFYNPKDEGRIPYNDPGINYDWETQTSSPQLKRYHENSGDRRGGLHRLGLCPHGDRRDRSARRQSR